MAVDENLIRLVDQRIRLAQVRDRATGACVTRATTGPEADVLFDGSTVAMPVKVLGNVFLRPGDRCVLDKYGTEWVVTGSFSALGLGETSYATQGPGAGSGSLTSAVYIDLQEVAVQTFDKAFDNTYVRMALALSAYSQTDGSSAYFGLRFTPVTNPAYTATDYTLIYAQFDSAAQGHKHFSGQARAVDIPAGRYSVQLRWRRNAGTGTPKVDGNDRFSIEIDEGVRQAVPIL